MVILEDVTKTYRTARGDINALDSVSLRVEKGEFVVINGPSGSGKTTLLMTIAAMLRPSRGTVCIEGKNIYDMGIRARANFRAENVGFVFQMFYLVPYLNVVDNIVLAGQAAGKNRGAGELKQLVQQFGLEQRALHKPSQLSAGEKQRTAIARALLNRPQIILADEPTGNLDSENATAVLGYLADFHRGGGTVIVVTHGAEAERFAERIIYLRDGGIDNSDQHQ
ncbi:MAG: ABC transporter ATP-binding protein [Planctomycetota bacterium]|jgi:ABC-type lipoprotein export system ATPase subunit